MVHLPIAPKISSPPGQRFECRDCPARCCRLPASIHISDEEARRYLAEPWVRERVGAEGVQIIEGGGLPVREKDRGPECVFLDDDLLCSLQKRFGHETLPRTCQAFPFAFTQGEKGVVIAQLSQLCPSIRDNYGLPVEKQLRTKLLQKGTTEEMSTEMGTLGGVTLSQTQYLRVARRWEEELASTASPATTLARIHDFTLAFEGALPPGVERVTDAAIDEALGQTDQHSPAPLVPRKSPSLHARVVFAYLLGYLCYPSRLKLAHRIGKAPASRLAGWRSLGNKIAWMIGWGTVDMLYVPKPFNLRRVNTVDRFLAESEGGLVRDYLRLVLQRRQIFSEPRHLLAVVLDLALATTLISRFARCRAAADGRTRVTPDDVREGISVAELVLLSHVDPSAHGPVMMNLRWLLITNREALRGVLATEA
jgi:lysine-N-methylase